MPVHQQKKIGVGPLGMSYKAEMVTLRHVKYASNQR